MNSLLIYAGLLVVSACALLIGPVLRMPKQLKQAENDNRDPTGQFGENIRSYRENLQDFQQQLESGELDQAGFERLKTELDKTLLEESTTVACSTGSAQNRYAWLLPAILALLIPLTTWVLYSNWGAYPQLQAYQDRQPLVEAMGQGQGGDLQQLAKRLEKRLQQQSDDIEGWLLLARTRMNFFPV